MLLTTTILHSTRVGCPAARCHYLFFYSYLTLSPALALARTPTRVQRRVTHAAVHVACLRHLAVSPAPSSSPPTLTCRALHTRGLPRTPVSAAATRVRRSRHGVAWPRLACVSTGRVRVKPGVPLYA